MKDKETVIINNKEYVYESYYQRLELKKSDGLDSIACPKCSNIYFSISYKSYECIANCKCGHFMTIYKG